MNQINLYGSIKDGKLSLDNKFILESWAKGLPEGEKIVAKFNISKNYKSERQLRLIYHEFREISGHTGYTVEEVKLMMKVHFGLCGTANIEGKEITFCKSISDFTIKELSKFIEDVDRWSSQTLNLPLLSYDDKTFLNETS